MDLLENYIKRNNLPSSNFPGEIMGELGSKIKKYRINSNMKQIDLANAIGISRSKLSLIENGKTNYSVINLLKIINYFNLTYNFFELFKVYPSLKQLEKQNKLRSKFNSRKRVR